MPVIGQQIDPNAVPAGTALAPIVSRHLFAMSDGARLAVWQGANGIVYAIRSTGNVWSAPVAIAGASGSLSQYAVGQNGNAVSLFQTSGSSAVVQIKLSYATGAVTVTSASYGGVGYVLTSPEVLYNTTLAAWLLAGFAAAASIVPVYTIQESSNSASIVANPSGISGAPRVHLTSSGSASNALYLSYQQSGSSLFVSPVYIAGTTVSRGTSESAYPGCTDFSAEIDASGNLDLVVLDERTSGLHSIVAVKRLGVNSYSSPITLYANTQGATPPVTNYDTPSGNLTVYVQSLANQANGELLSIQRAGGTWGAAQTTIGGDALGYASPSANRYTVSGTSEYLYLSGTTTTLLQYNGAANGSTPTVPVPVSPSGNIAGLSPNFVYNSANPTPSDLPQAREVLVQRVSDNVTMWDTGRITTPVPAYAGTALVYGTQYRWQVKEWDTVLNSPSAYSTVMTFTPQSPPVETITGVTNNGTAVVNGGDITSTTVAVTISHSQSGGNSAAQSNLVFLADDGTTILGQTGFTALSPAIASGASFTITSDLSNGGTVALSNGTYYRIRVDVIDSTGLTASSGQFRVHTAWTPPTPVTGLSALPNPVTGTVRLSWQIPTGTTALRVYTRRSPLPGHTPDPWIQFQGVGLVGRLTVYPLLLTKTDYAVQTFNAQGVNGTMEVLPNVILNLLFGRSYTARITDTVNPSTSVPVGLANDAGSASTWQHVTAPISSIYEGHTSPTTDYLPTSYYTAIGRKYLVFALDTDNSTNLAWRDVRAALISMDGGNLVLYRDMDNHAYICTLTNFVEGQADAVSYNVSFDLISTTIALNPLALWSA